MEKTIQYDMDPDKKENTLEAQNSLQNIYETDWSRQVTRDAAASDAPTPQTLGNATCSSGARNVKLSAVVSDMEAALIQRARVVSWVSVIVSIFLGLTSVIVGISDRALALVGLGVQILLDAQSSIIVIWRFKQPKERLYEDQADAIQFKVDRDARRERDANYSVGLIFIACSLVLALSATYKILTYDPNDVNNMSMKAVGHFEKIYSWPTGVIFLFLAWVKWTLGNDLGSEVLKLDSLASFMGAFMALVVGIAGLMEEHDGAWMADPVAALFISSLLLFTGYRTLIEARRLGERHQRFEDKHVDITMVRI